LKKIKSCERKTNGVITSHLEKYIVNKTYCWLFDGRLAKVDWSVNLPAWGPAGVSPEPQAVTAE
jgi:hypothetical protein